MEAAQRPSEPRRVARFGVTSLLIGLVMLPVTVLCAVAGSVVLSHQATATQAEALEQGVVELSAQVELYDALHDQQSLLAFDIRFVELGTTRDEASTFLGLDFTAQAARARAQATAAIARLGPRSSVSADSLRMLHADIDGAVITPTDAAPRLRDIEQSAKDAVIRGLDRLQGEAQDKRLIAALETLRAANVLADRATPQVIDLSVVWFPSSSDTLQSTTAALARLSAHSADFDTGKARIRQRGVTTVNAQLDRIEADPAVRAFDQAVTATLLGVPLTEAGAELDLDEVAATFHGHLVLDALLEDLVSTTVTAIRDEARHVATSERSGFVAWALGAATLALGSIGIAMWLSRSISKPLKDLADYAHAVNEGDLDFEPSVRKRGPRETRVAFDVFSDLVANLQLVDAKANALAHCNFADPVLGEPLPGRLGRSLESSVALLSGSIVERDSLQTHLAHEATHDSLTGLYNRPAAITGLQSAINRAARTGATTALLFIDLNEFKTVNDRHGHEVGDAVLREIANRMTVDLRVGDFAARLGGDEFIIVAEGVAGVGDATALARRIIRTIGEPIEVGSLRITIGAAIGIAMTLDGPEDPLRLLARADAAMYRAKYHEQSAMEIFDADLQRQMTEREDIEAALAAALVAPGGGGLQLHYQPVLDGSAGTMVGVEALIRWNRPGHGPLQPDSFIPIAEASGLIIDVDCWVLAEATRQLIEWSADPDLADLHMSVNISGRHLLSGQLPNHIRAVIDRTGVDPHRLSIEITETVLLTDLAVAATELHAVRSLGVSVAIDDFGTGYTSLAHLEQLPIDTIKIDRSFIGQLHLRRGSTLVRMVIDLGHAIGINVVAEGVETNEEMSSLQAMGADQLQGFRFTRALAPTELATWAQQHVAAARQLVSASP